MTKKQLIEEIEKTEIDILNLENRINNKHIKLNFLKWELEKEKDKEVEYDNN